MASYPGRSNPVIDALQGEISTRQLRIMIEHLPPDNAANREANGAWGDLERILHDVSSQLRIFRTEFWNAKRDPKQAALPTPELLPTPETDREEKLTDRPAEVLEVERNFLQKVLNRPNPQ